MKRIIAIIITCLVALPAFAQPTYNNDAHLNTNSNNQGTVAIDSHNAGDTINGNNIVEAGIVNVQGSQQSITTTSKQEIKSNQAATAVAPGLTTGGVDVCLGSVSGGASVAGFGISGGSTTLDENCVMIKQAKLLTALGLKDAAIALMMQHDENIMMAIMMAYPELYKHLNDEQRIQDVFKN